MDPATWRLFSKQSFRPAVLEGMQVHQRYSGKWRMFILFIACAIIACNEVYRQPVRLQLAHTNVLQPGHLLDSALFEQSAFPATNNVYTHQLQPEQLLHFARSLMGTPYVYGATNPEIGLDCSGFINYIFGHFNVQVPRSSISFTQIQKEVPLEAAQPGDIILFTGTDPEVHTVGHMGMIEKVGKDAVFFIHASSGKVNAVTISPLDAYYKGRFVKLIRVFPDRSGG